jgi:hypothetical protein
VPRSVGCRTNRCKPGVTHRRLARQQMPIAVARGVRTSAVCGAPAICPRVGFEKDSQSARAAPDAIPTSRPVVARTWSGPAMVTKLVFAAPRKCSVASCVSPCAVASNGVATCATSRRASVIGATPEPRGRMRSPRWPSCAWTERRWSIGRPRRLRGTGTLAGHAVSATKGWRRGRSASPESRSRRDLGSRSLPVPTSPAREG